MTKIDIEDVQRLNVESGDVLLVTVPGVLTPQEAEHIRSALETRLPVRVIVKPAGVQVEVVTRAVEAK